MSTQRLVPLLQVADEKTSNNTLSVHNCPAFNDQYVVALLRSGQLLIADQRKICRAY